MDWDTIKAYFSKMLQHHILANSCKTKKIFRSMNGAEQAHSIATKIIWPFPRKLLSWAQGHHFLEESGQLIKIYRTESSQYPDSFASHSASGVILAWTLLGHLQNHKWCPCEITIRGWKMFELHILLLFKSFNLTLIWF